MQLSALQQKVLSYLILVLIFCQGGFVSYSQEAVVLAQEQAAEDLEWLKFSLEYVHPRLYKYDTKETIDQRFDSVVGMVEEGISGLDFLSLVSKLNAGVNCGHLYTIPQGALRQEVLEQKVMPFSVKVIGTDYYIFYDISRKNLIPNGSRIVSINDRPITEIDSLIRSGIATDGHIETRKDRLIERSYSSIYGFDYYYHLHVDRNSTFAIEYEYYNTGKVKRVIKQGVAKSDRAEQLQQNYQIDQKSWFKTPSPQFELIDSDYGLLTISRSFYDQKIDPDYDSLLSAAFEVLHKENISNLIIDLRNNEGGSEDQEMTLMSCLCDQPFKLYQNIYQSHIDFRPLK